MNANKSAPWFRILALCTAVGLGGGYVWRQQQKAVSHGEKTIAPKVISDSEDKDIAPTPSPVHQEQTDRLLLSGSKSGIFIEVKPEEPKERTLMPGSKSSVIDPVTLPAEEKKRILFSGSKGGILQLGPKIDLELPSPEKPNAPKQRTLLPSSKSIPMPIFRERRIAPEDQPKPNKP